LTWKPGRMALVTQTARVRISQERIRFMLGALVDGVVTLPTGTRRMDSIVKPHRLR
jgi:hypothetical protein